MEQALASDMWETPQFEEAYIEFLSEFDRANAVASLIKAEKLVREMYYNIPYNEFGRDMLRWCWLDGALGEFKHQWGLSDLSHAY